MKILSVEEMVAAEKAADQMGHSYATMMELAGTALGRITLDRAIDRSLPVLILVGPGNNGGDGLVAARFLRGSGMRVSVFLARPKFLNSKREYQEMLDLGIELIEPIGKMLPELFDQRLAESGTIIDALLGTGISRPISGVVHTVLIAVKGVVGHDKTKYVVAADCPSGVNCDNGEISKAAVQADLTVAFGAAKIGHVLFPAKDYLGELVAVDIGIDPMIMAKSKTELATEELMQQLVPRRPHDGHKGTFGKVVIAGGSKEYFGAPLLSGLGAFRTGTGLVAMLLPAVVRQSVAGRLLEATFFPVSDEEELGQASTNWIETYLADYDALLVGPGLSMADHFVHACLNKLKHQPIPAVFDADALNVISRRSFLRENLPKNLILTPHPGEMARLLGISTTKLAELNRVELVREYAEKWSCILLLKGANTVIAAPDGRVIVLPFANPLLSMAGSGDVLGGIIVSLLGQGLDPFDAAVLGGWLHGAAGELGREKYGDRGMLASEITDSIPIVIRRLLNNHD